jgi:hypothetical protein
MTPIEAKAAVSAFRTSVGPKADVSVSVNDRYEKFALSGSLWPFGIGKGSGYLRVEGDSFEEVIDLLTAKWSEHAAEHRTQAIKKMALKIISLTADFGQCSDAALREEFDAGQIASLGEEACALANSMAGKGPFAILRLAGANAA